MISFIAMHAFQGPHFARTTNGVTVDDTIASMGLTQVKKKNNAKKKSSSTTNSTAKDSKSKASKSSNSVANQSGM